MTDDNRHGDADEYQYIHVHERGVLGKMRLDLWLCWAYRRLKPPGRIKEIDIM